MIKYVKLSMVFMKSFKVCKSFEKFNEVVKVPHSVEEGG
jgi:hypothetical protein